MTTTKHITAPARAGRDADSPHPAAPAAQPGDETMLTATNAIIEEAYAELVRFQRERLVEFAYPHANKAREILRDLIGKEDAEEIDRNIQRERESG